MNELLFTETLNNQLRLYISQPGQDPMLLNILVIKIVNSMIKRVEH